MGGLPQRSGGLGSSSQQEVKFERDEDMNLFAVGSGGHELSEPCTGAPSQQFGGATEACQQEMQFERDENMSLFAVGRDGHELSGPLPALSGRGARPHLSQGLADQPDQGPNSMGVQLDGSEGMIVAENEVGDAFEQQGGATHGPRGLSARPPTRPSARAAPLTSTGTAAWQ